MWQVTLLSLVAATSTATTFYREAHQFTSAPIMIESDLRFNAWVWAPDGLSVVCNVNEAEIQILLDLNENASQNTATQYSWQLVSEITLTPGDWQITADERVAAVFLSPNNEATPQIWLKDRRILPQPESVSDRRSEIVKHTDTVFTMPQYETLESWESMAKTLRRRMLIGCGLYDQPLSTPLNTQIFDRVIHEDYSIEKVHFEAFPGFLVTGSLYRPVGKEAPHPGVVSPHGHWAGGRLENSESGSVAARGITLARMGMVVFTYDMLGYNDSLQFDHNHLNDAEKLWGLHPFALQLLSGIRAVDMLLELPDVDPKRIAATGASGGGTQTFALMAVDPRIAVAAPVNMISSTMQGGCLCENAPLIRLENSNMEIAAMMAPRPLLLVSATGDWTRETPRVEYPAIRSIYRLYDAVHNLEQVQIDAGHNYNRQSREAVYRFFGKHLMPDTDWSEYVEPDYEMPSESELRLFADGLPDSYPNEETLISAWIKVRDYKEFAEKNEHPVWWNIRAEESALHQVYRDMLGLSLPHANDLDAERLHYEIRQDHVLEHWIIRRPACGEEIPALFYRSSGEQAQDAVLLVHGDGKAALAGDTAGPGVAVQMFLDKGIAVLSIDAYLTGEHHSPFGLTEPVRVGRFHDTFQPTDTARRVQDIITAAAFLDARRDISKILGVGGLGEAGVWSLMACVLDPQIPRVVADMNYFDHESDDAWLKRHYIPGIRAMGGLKSMINSTSQESIYRYHVLPETHLSDEQHLTGTIDDLTLALEILLK